MPGSTGTISRIIQPATNMGEDNRQTDQNIHSSPGASTQTNERWCLIYKIDKENSLVQLVDAKTKKIAFGGKWVEIVDADSIVDRYGQLQKGMLVRALYTGVGGQNVMAQIEGRPGSKPTRVRRENNKHKMSWYRIAPPGMGVGA